MEKKGGRAGCDQEKVWKWPRPAVVIVATHHLSVGHTLAEAVHRLVRVDGRVVVERSRYVDSEHILSLLFHIRRRPSPSPEYCGALGPHLCFQGMDVRVQCSDLLVNQIVEFCGDGLLTIGEVSHPPPLRPNPLEVLQVGGNPQGQLAQARLMIMCLSTPRGF